ncbi:hypothetical protein Tsubulata_030721 [Turnera subulata]|uniref:CCHC-type domain-containing protein n=1 Tax=Turnera subulata TaxID=218843 RepID=A0A9Q0FZB9_9ROSI|nr:hypothetical protein Tsubulata_030721 [Turnera subulata]
MSSDPNIHPNLSAAIRLTVNRFYLVGKIITDKPLKAGLVKSILQRFWVCDGNFQVLEKGDNKFLFHFSKEADRKKVLDGQPWLVANNQLVIQEWSPHLAFEEIDLLHASIWVQVHGLALDDMNQTNAEMIGNGFAGLEEVVFNLEDILREDSFMRMRVRYRVDKPLPPGFFNRRPNGERHWIPLRYEWMPEICYKCGITGHIANRCRNLKLVLDPNLPDEQKYGPHMRAKYQPKRTMKVFGRFDFHGRRPTTTATRVGEAASSSTESEAKECIPAKGMTEEKSFVGVVHAPEVGSGHGLNSLSLGSIPEVGAPKVQVNVASGVVSNPQTLDLVKESSGTLVVGTHMVESEGFATHDTGFNKKRKAQVLDGPSFKKPKALEELSHENSEVEGEMNGLEAIKQIAQSFMGPVATDLVDQEASRIHEDDRIILMNSEVEAVLHSGG